MSGSRARSICNQWQSGMVLLATPTPCSLSCHCFLLLFLATAPPDTATPCYLHFTLLPFLASGTALAVTIPCHCHPLLLPPLQVLHTAALLTTLFLAATISCNCHRGVTAASSDGIKECRQQEDAVANICGSKVAVAGSRTCKQCPRASVARQSPLLTAYCRPETAAELL